LLVTFQIFLIISGNLSFLNWLTIVPILACFDDAVWRRLVPGRWRARAETAARTPAPRAVRIAAALVAAMVAWLSIDVVNNLFSSHQRMNAGFGAFDLVNTYGAFGSVGRERHEIVFEGTADAVITGRTQWREYEFKCKPGDPQRRPCVVSPYHFRLDWQIWFAAMSTPERYPWTLHLVWKLLHGDRATLRLLANDPFPGRPPRFIRARLYRYEFTRPGTPGDAYWKRTLLGDWLPPLSADDPRLRRFLAVHGWIAGDE
jgi:hypothetical protein